MLGGADSWTIADRICMVGILALFAGIAAPASIAGACLAVFYAVAGWLLTLQLVAIALLCPAVRWNARHFANKVGLVTICCVLAVPCLVVAGAIAAIVFVLAGWLVPVAIALAGD